jgi:hypothetical protein
MMEKITHNKRKMILIGLSVLGTGVAGFLGWNYWKKKNNNQEEEQINTADSANDSFPLRFGSKGKRVTQLQNALVKKFGKSILPKYGVDGMFGKEVESALVRAKLPTTINETLFTQLVGKGLAGINSGEPIITIADCEIYKSDGVIRVPKNMVLGEAEIINRDWVFFYPKNSSEVFRVKSEFVKPYLEK